MVALSLKICVRQCNVVKTMQFEPSTPVYDACRIIRERVPEAQTGQGLGTAEQHSPHGDVHSVLTCMSRFTFSV